MTDSTDVPSTANLELAADMRESLRLAVHMVRILDYPGTLSTAQVSVLNILDRAPARVGDLARLGGVTQPGMSQLISRLEKAGLVRRVDSDADARVTLVEMTEQGRSTLERVNRERNGVLAAHLDRPAEMILFSAGASETISALANITLEAGTEVKEGTPITTSGPHGTEPRMAWRPTTAMTDSAITMIWVAIDHCSNAGSSRRMGGSPPARGVRSVPQA